jgi:hypothetical protein
VSRSAKPNRVDRRSRWGEVLIAFGFVAVCAYIVATIGGDILYGSDANPVRRVVTALIARNNLQLGTIVMLLAVVHLGLGIRRFRRTGNRTGLLSRVLVSVMAVAAVIAIWFLE